jgi:uncharacterized membrane protein YqaE (UPF0057 family)
MLFVLCAVPPLAVLLTIRKDHFWMGALSLSLSVLLTVFGWVPGIIHALFVVSDFQNEERTRQITHDPKDL